MTATTALASTLALLSIVTTPLALARGAAWGSAPVAHTAVHRPAHPHRPVIPPPVFVPPVVTFNPFVPAFVAVTPIVVYEGTLPPVAQPRAGVVAVPEVSQPAVAPRAPGAGTWMVGQMPAKPAAPGPRTHGGEPVLEIRRTSR